MNRLFSILIALFIFLSVEASIEREVVNDSTQNPIFQNIQYKLETSGSFSGNKTPLWLNANQYGLSSLEKLNGYVRGAIERPLSVDNAKKWGIGYGLDIAVPVNYTSNIVIQQAYVEGKWWHGTLTIGAKEQPMELKNNALSSGSQTLGINARPVPQVRLALPEYWTLPFGNGWLHLKGHIAYGVMTDDNWQHDFTAKKSKYADNVLYHSKAGYLKIANEEVFCPWSFELGLEMVCLFGGTSYIPNDMGGIDKVDGGTGVKDYWKAFFPGGSDVIESTYKNVQGDQLGSWVAKIKYSGDWHSFSIYADKFFEDHSSMFQLDYDGYGSGDEWQIRKKKKYLVYDVKDWMLGFEYNYNPNHWINDFVFEYLYTKYQSGPIYHDHTPAIPDHIGGKDDYYNHYIYPGYQHWGQVMGNPLYLSPIYDKNGDIYIGNNRFIAYHIGLSGRPTEFTTWRFLTTYQEGWGTYDAPYSKKRHNMSMLVETSYSFHKPNSHWLRGVTLRGRCGVDFGSILGGINYGFQFVVAKVGLFN
nr:capsule assembly Wzi family protein [uncultured Prevotella sp.]